jgi:hypothetical protein
MRSVAASALLVMALAASAVSACPECRPAVEAGIFNERFWGRLSITLLPFIVVLFVVAVLHRVGRGQASNPPGEE